VPPWLLGILAGIIGGVAALLVSCFLGGFLCAAVREMNRAGWPSWIAVGVRCVWLLAAIVLVCSFPIALVAWITEAEHMRAAANRIAGASLVTVVLALPFSLWLARILAPGDDDGNQPAS